MKNVAVFAFVGLMACTQTNATTDAPATSDGGPLVLQCQLLAMHMAAMCAGSDPRPCVWNAYAQLCRTGNTQLLIDSMNCLDQTTCRTFSDANQGNACLAMVHSTGETSTVRSVDMAMCTACAAMNCDMPLSQGEVLPYLSDADANMLASCRGGACQIDAIVAACRSVPGVGLFSTCQ